jgi:hypothetical protein
VRRLVTVIRPDLQITGVVRKNGKSFVRHRIRELNRAARSVPVFVIIDLDTPVPCPADVVRLWLPTPIRAKPPFSRRCNGDRVMDNGGSRCVRDVLFGPITPRT